MMPDRELQTIFDRLAAELIDLAGRAQGMSRKVSQPQAYYDVLSDSTRLVEDLGNCLTLARGARSMLKLGQRK